MRYRRFVLAMAMGGSSAFAATTASAQQPGMGRGMGMGHDSATAAQMGTIHELMMSHGRIKRTVTNLPNGVRTVTESDDPRVAALIKKHALDMTARVGVAAMHRAMMSGMTGAHDTSQHAMDADSAFAAMQTRGKQAMGVDQYTSTHQFEAASDGGRIELQRDVDDSAGVAQIREHLQGIAKAFSGGDFSTPAFVHLGDVPGAKVMTAKRPVITYTFRPLPRGGELRITSTDAQAIAAIHEFLAFQRREHRTS